jgi:hypothetical protein
MCAVLLLLLPVAADAQAWAPPAGVGSVGLSAQAISNSGHRLTDGSLLPVGRSRTAATYAFIDYALTDRISIAGGIPLVFARYVSPDPAVGDRAVDACRCWQHGWQDVGFTARVNLVNGGFGLTPSVTVAIPSHAYEYKGEAVVGRRLKELGIAIDGGIRASQLSPNLTISGRYAYTVVERVLDLPNNRSNVTADATYAIGRRLAATGSAVWQRTHGGLRAGTGPPPPIAPLPWGEIATDELFEQHDRLLRDNNFRAGVTVSYSWTRVETFVSFVSYLRGTDTHAGRALSTGVSVPFEIDRR